MSNPREDLVRNESQDVSIYRMAPHGRILVRFGHVTIGVALHMPMFWMGRKMGFRLVGMPMGTGMLVGMGLIILGIAAAAYGLLPRRQPQSFSYGSIAPPEDSPLTKAHWIHIALLAVALVVDVMKAATLGFVMPGMRTEYGLGAAAVAVLPGKAQAVQAAVAPVV